VSPIRARKSIGGKWFRVNFTLRSVVDFLRDWLPDGHVQPGRRPWSSITIGSRSFSYNTKRRTGRVDLPGPFSYETPRIDGWGDRLATREHPGAVSDGQHCRHWYDNPETPCCRCGYNGPDETTCAGEPRNGRPPVERWTDDRGRRWERTANGAGGTTTSYLPDPVSDDEAEQQACPRCHAEPDAPCRTRGTGRPTKPHLPRVELARLARAYPEPAAEQGGGEIPPWGTPPR
jgi:hypothetical protein